MKKVLWSLLSVALFAGLYSIATAAGMTMTGMISDSACGASHAKMIGAHPDAKMSEKECTLACVKNGGKFVFVSGGKVYDISNQKFAGLTDHAGETVSLTGDMTGTSVNVTKIAAGGKKK